MSAERFTALFKSNTEHVTKLFDTGIRMFHETYTFSDIAGHIAGKQAIGLSPIQKNGNCWWGVLDVDTHKKGDSIDFDDLEAKNNALDTPLVICQSRNKGAHLFLFLTNETPAKLVVEHLKSLSKKLGFTDSKQCEIFPKQTFLGPGDAPNCLNLPYFGETRKMFFEGELHPLDTFLAVAENRVYTLCDTPPSLPNIFSQNVIEQAPPCIVDMLQNGVDSGGRNEAMYNFTVFAKKVDEHNYLNACMDFNSNCLTPSLPYSEAKNAVKSASRRDYNYKCSTEPCRSRCNSAVCITRKYGIKPTAVGKNEDGTDVFTKLTKILTEPVTWELTVDGATVKVPTETLLDFRKLRHAIVETLTKIIPQLKNDTWDEILKPLMANANIVYAPDDASAGGLLFERLKDFLNTATQDTANTATLISRGVPAVVQIEGETVCAFKGSAFIEYMKRRKYDDLKGAQLWLALREIGVKHSTIDLNDDIVDVWYIDYKPVSKKIVFIENREEF